MAIRHRIIKPKPLLYHKLYGGMENPPVDRERTGPEPWPPNLMQGVQAVGLIHGVSRHKYFPPKLKINPHNVIVGLLRNHDPQRHGLGPGQGYSSWVATAIIERGYQGMRCTYVTVDPKTGKRTVVTSRELCDLFKFSSRSEPKKPFYIPPINRGFKTQQELNLEEEALEGVYLDYEELHGVTFPWKAMRYRKRSE